MLGKRSRGEKPSMSDRPTTSTLTVSRVSLDRDLDEQFSKGKGLSNRLGSVLKAKDRGVWVSWDIKARTASFPSYWEYYEEYRRWDSYNLTLLKKVFTTSEELDQYRTIRDTYKAPGRLAYLYNAWGLYEIVEMSIKYLLELKDRLYTFEESGVERTHRVQTPVGSGVFVVHGHNDAVKESIADFVARATGRRPVILHEQPNSGRTIIEKFEDNAGSIEFAIVLLTADDEGGEHGSSIKRLRSRQNVIFEAGFFVAALGRSRVAMVYEMDVELPSDLSGILYTALDPGGAWRLALAREMQAAGFDVDLNRVIE